ncbi:MAG: hypothetical protein KatS3mg087_0901 [Patescibacteria group bacterium]|nr:MAG: hypothetical protein KatS3mg087_0901 [Patescibacteria group bacterium]
MDIFIISLLIFVISTILISQGLFNSYLMLYAWAKVQENVRFRSPRIYAKPQHTFTAIIPARHEEDVIGHTIRSVARISYPLEMTEIIVVLRQDDHGTITKAQEALTTIGQKNIRILTL